MSRTNGQVKKIPRSAQKRGSAIRKELLDMAGNQCRICKFSEPWALEFHHLKDKKFTLSSHILGTIQDKTLILKEFAKCVLLCSNCHKGVHGGFLNDELEEILRNI